MRSAGAHFHGNAAGRHRPNPHKIKARGSGRDLVMIQHFGVGSREQAYFYAVFSVKPA
jgi:hypothetical protein